jgi:hypothetical protein
VCVTIADDVIRRAPDDVLLPEGTRLLHIGPHKTGTTTLQGSFHAARRKLERQGVFYASPNRQAMQAARAVAGRPSAYIGGRVPAEENWVKLVQDVDASTAKRVLISAEAFADAGPPAARRLINDLDPALIHVVATLRPFARILPSQWQQYVQNGLARSFDEWLRAIFEEPDRAGSPAFWHRHRHDALIERWAGIVGPDRMTVVIVDERDHEASLRTFERLLGLSVGTLRPPEGIYNRSLTRAEVELVRAMHGAAIKLGLEKGLRLNLVLHGGASSMKLRQPGKDEPRIEIPGWAQDRVTTAARAIVEGIRASGVRVIGNLDSLVDPPVPGDTPQAHVSADGWSASLGRALLGVLIETGLTRGPNAVAGQAWLDDPGAVTTARRRATSEVLANWSSSRLASIVFGRVRSVVPPVLVRPLNFARRIAMGLGRRGGSRKRREGAQRPSVDLAARQRDGRRGHELEDAE